MKACTKCGETKACGEYSVRLASRDGLQASCKACAKARDADYRKVNVDRIKARRADYYKANADQFKAYQADYRRANIDQIKAYQAANPHIRWEAGYRRRARAFGFEPVVESFTREEMIAYWGNGERCIYCDGPFQEIEHLIPVGLGGHHVISNVAPSCGPCNRVNTNTIRNTRKTLISA